jgi:hypothetical protein
MHVGRSGFARVAAVATTGACCLAAAACGGGSSTNPGAAPSVSRTADPLASLTSDQIQAEALSDAEAAPTLTVDGSVAQTSQTYTVDLAFKHGLGCAGTVGVGGEGTIKIIKIGKTIYLNPDKQFWTVNSGSEASAVIALVNGRYIQTTTTDKNAAGLADLCNVSQLLNGEDGSQSSTGGESSPPTTVTKGPVTTIGGTRVLKLKDSDGSFAYVTDTSKPEIVKVTAPKGSADGSGTITVTVGTPVTLTPPPASQVIAGSQLGF